MMKQIFDSRKRNQSDIRSSGCLILGKECQVYWAGWALGVVWTVRWFKHRWESIWTNAVKESTDYSHNIKIQAHEGMMVLAL